MNRIRLHRGLSRLALTVAALSALFAPASSPAAVITVNGTGDTIAVDGFVTLREALTAANTNAASGDAPAGSAGLDEIRFNIAGAPGVVHTIQPLSALPTITDRIFIDGYSQLGASPNTLPDGDNAFLAIDLDGSSTAFVAGLVINANSSVVQGLVIERFDNEGILVLGLGNVIRGNFIGTDASGNLDRGNGVTGVALLSSFNLVGGTAPADRNLISGNGFHGVGVLNVSTTGNRIEGNFIGTDDDGALPLPNAGAGVRLYNVAGNTVGGLAPGAGNVIAFNGGGGIEVADNAGLANELSGNSIFDNAELGIDLENDGVTANDLPAGLDADDGPNGLQNFPALTRAFTDGASTTVEGVLDSAASTIHRVELFASPTCDASGHGEGALFLGWTSAATNASGHGVFAFVAPFEVPLGHAVSATATDPAGSTSELAACVIVPESSRAVAELLAVACVLVSRRRRKPRS